MPLKAPVGAAYAIEAFAHVADQAGLFAECVRLLARGGRLIVIDDALSASPPSPEGEAEIKRFRSGWCLPGIYPFAGNPRGMLDSCHPETLLVNPVLARFDLPG